MYQNYHFTATASPEDVVNAVDKIMNQMQWQIKHEFDKFDMSADYVRTRQRGLFGRASADEHHVEMDVTVRYREAGGQVNIYLMSDEAVGDSVVAGTSPPNPDRKKLLMETRNALRDGLRARDML